MLRDRFDKELLESTFMAAQLLDYTIEEQEECISIRKIGGHRIKLSLNKKDAIDFEVKDKRFRQYMWQEGLKKERDINNVLHIIMDVL